ncbi:MAG: hypothetical protein FJ254_08050 [Phycisphaerae bacterium]|nr:hypothetical protein [Phycisphaerae bacterium]
MRRLAIVLFTALPSLAHAQSPFASSVVSYAPGSSPAGGFTIASSALGEPTRFTGGPFFPQAVTPFQPAFMTSEIVSIGAGGELVVAFDHDVVNDPRNPFGVDLIVFGNSFFGDAAYPLGIPSGIFAEGGQIAVSADGTTWVAVAGIDADGFAPTCGWRDATPYATTPGSQPTDFTKPIDPTITMASMIGQDWSAVRAMYDGSGGGAGIDLAPLGLSSIRFVRVRVPVGAMQSAEIDGFSDVTPVGISGDLDGNGSVDGADLGILLSAFGTAEPSADLDGNGSVDGGDLGALLAAWT